VFQRGNSKKRLSAAFLVPLVGLLDVIGTPALDENSRSEILKMTQEVQGCLPAKPFKMSALAARV